MAKETNMQTTQVELKAVAKAIGASLKRAGTPVPHSNLLHAVSAALNQRDWNTLKATLKQPSVEPVKQRDVTLAKVQPTPVGPEVLAEFWTDDRIYETTFDARPFLMQASDEALASILEAGFSGSESTDDVALFAAERLKVEHLVEAFEYLDAVQRSPSRNPPGFECRVDKAGYLHWMNSQRPGVLAPLLCTRHGVDFVQATEPEIAGMWDWLDQSGNACDQSFNTREEAVLDAYRSLNLLQEALDGNLL